MFRVISKPFSAHSQRGAALVTALLLLVVMTILALSVMQMSRVQERMVGNTRDLTAAFEAAEAAVRNGEAMIHTQATAPADCSLAPSCISWIPGSVPDLASASADWWTNNAKPFADPAGNAMSAVKLNPTYVIEHVGFVLTGDFATGVDPPVVRDFYQVTGRSTGASGLANAIVQTTFARKF